MISAFVVFNVVVVASDIDRIGLAATIENVSVYMPYIVFIIPGMVYGKSSMRTSFIALGWLALSSVVGYFEHFPRLEYGPVGVSVFVLFPLISAALKRTKKVS